MKYTYRSRAGIVGVTANIAGKELEKIRTKNGGKLITKEVVNEARATNSPLHPVFEWDNEKASEEYRLIQARKLIRSIHIIQETGKKENKYVHIKMDKENYYQDQAVAVLNVNEYQAALREATIKLNSAEHALNELQSKAKASKRKKDAVYVGVAIDAMATARTALEKLSQPSATM